MRRTTRTAYDLFDAIIEAYRETGDGIEMDVRLVAELQTHVPPLERTGEAIPAWVRINHAGVVARNKSFEGFAPGQWGQVHVLEPTKTHDPLATDQSVERYDFHFFVKTPRLQDDYVMMAIDVVSVEVGIKQA
jgi:hypothetical protein